MTVPDGASSQVGALTVLRERIATLRFPLEIAGVNEVRRVRRETVAQLDDYVLPRVSRPDAPMLAVVGGPTGVGKSTLVNAVLGRAVTQSGVLRPTTRAPVLAYHPDDGDWFTSDRILPELTRAPAEGPVAPGAVRLVADEAVPQGLALLDAPDIDSVVTENRDLASQLLRAADLWVFVTSAARYADAVPWEFFHEAAARSAAVSVVLDRVHPEAVDEIRHHLAALLDNHGLGDSPMFVVEETQLAPDGLLPFEQVEPIRAWLTSLGADAVGRSALVRRTLEGAVADVLSRAPVLAGAADAQSAAADQLRGVAVGAYDAALAVIDRVTRDGSLLRGEVLVRWRDFVGTGEFLRSLEEWAGRVRDWLTAYMKGRPRPARDVADAIEQSLRALLDEEANKAAERADAAWRADPAGEALLGRDDLSRAGTGFADRVAEEVRDWQSWVADQVRAEGRARDFTPRALSHSVSGLGVALTVAVFGSAGNHQADDPAADGAAGGASADGPAAVGRRLLEAVFGADVADRLVDTARSDLLERVEALLVPEAARFTGRLDVLAVDPGGGLTIREALRAAEVARHLEATT